VSTNTSNRSTGSVGTVKIIVKKKYYGKGKGRAIRLVKYTQSDANANRNHFNIEPDSEEEGDEDEIVVGFKALESKARWMNEHEREGGLELN
jgi:hypothetical protein